MHAYRKIEDEKEIEKVYRECVVSGRKHFAVLNALRKLAMLLSTLAVCFGMRFMYNYSETASVWTIIIIFMPVLLLMGKWFETWRRNLNDNLDYFNELIDGDFYSRVETLDCAVKPEQVVRLYVKSKDGVMIPIAHQKFRGKDETP